MTRQSSVHKRDAILTAAIDLFRTKGLPHTSTRDLTEVMGISRSHIYHYFPNWQALCIAALDQFMTADLQEADDELVAISPEQALPLLADWFLPREADPDWLIYADAWQISARSEPYKELAQRITLGWDALFRKTIERGCAAGVFGQVNAQQAARQLGAMINGYADVLSLNMTEEKRQQALADIYMVMDILLKPTQPRA